VFDVSARSVYSIQSSDRKKYFWIFGSAKLVNLRLLIMQDVVARPRDAFRFVTLIVSTVLFAGSALVFEVQSYSFYELLPVFIRNASPV
jgi:hypothetical protein